MFLHHNLYRLESLIKVVDNTHRVYNNFWYHFDNFFLFKRNDSIDRALDKVKPYEQLVDLFYYHQSMGSLNTGYRTNLEKIGITEDIKLLANSQLDLFDKYLQGDSTSERTAFELFGQGLLFDNEMDENGLPRRGPGTKIHMMDSSVTGFVVWHAFIKAVIVLGFDKRTERWLRIDRYIALAAAILSALIKDGRAPQQTLEPNINQPLDEQTIEQLRTYWLNQSVDDIDNKIPHLEKVTITEHI